MIVNTLKKINGKMYPVIEEVDEPIIEIPKTEEINILKQQLSASDYKAIKYAEGWISEKEYAPIKAERQAIREQINVLEHSISQEVMDIERDENNS